MCWECQHSQVPIQGHKSRAQAPSACVLVVEQTVFLPPSALSLGLERVCAVESSKKEPSVNASGTAKSLAQRLS